MKTSHFRSGGLCLALFAGTIVSYAQTNTNLGSLSLSANTTGTYNTAIGYSALRANTTGDHNTAVGASSFFSNKSGRNNAGLGTSALYNNTSGAENNAFGHAALLLNTVGSSNIAIGAFSLNNNSSGHSNIAIGSRALNLNKSGSQSIAIGDSALYNSNVSSGQSIAVGSKALYGNTTGVANTAIGTQSLQQNATGGYNTAVGMQALINNNADYGTAIGALSLTYSTGYGNSGFGYKALSLTGTGYGNTGVGFLSGFSNTIGYLNTFVGYYCDVSASNMFNATAIGNGAIVNGSNKMRFGNAAITAIEAYCNFYTISDSRAKKDVKEEVPGLAFIKGLRPVTYHYKVKELTDKYEAGRNGLKETPVSKQLAFAGIESKEKKLYSGFIAQEVEAAAKKINYEFSGVLKPESDNDLYSVSYSDFVVPLVKAVKELSDSNDARKAEITDRDIKIDSLEARLGRLEQLVTGYGRGSLSLSDAHLDQNSPNPVRGSTRISYTMPASYGRAKVMITDMNGRVMKTVSINGSGKGFLTVDVSTLSSGSYPYALYIDGQLMGARQMLVVR